GHALESTRGRSSSPPRSPPSPAKPTPPPRLAARHCAVSAPHRSVPSGRSLLVVILTGLSPPTPLPCAASGLVLLAWQSPWATSSSSSTAPPSLCAPFLTGLLIAPLPTSHLLTHPSTLREIASSEYERPLACARGWCALGIEPGELLEIA